MKNKIGKLFNYVLYKILPHKEQVIYSPTTLSIEVTTRCNFNCSYCSTSKDRNTQEANNLTYEQFCYILKCFKKSRTIALSGSGEPLLNPKLYSMVEYARKQGYISFVTSNGSLPLKKYEELLSVSPNYLEISIKGTSKQEFSKITGIDDQVYHSVLENLKQITKIRKNGKLPMVILSYVCTRESIWDIPKLAEIATSCAVDELWLYNLIPNADLRNESECLYKEDEKNVKKNIELSCNRFPQLKIKPPLLYNKNSKKRKCSMPFTTLRIGVDGNISGCARAISANREYGNVYKDHNVFNSNHVKHLRSSFLKNHFPLRYECCYCSGCT